MNIDIDQLKEFLKESSGHMYAGDGKEIKSQRPEFIEMEWQDGDWYIRDSYTGWFQAPGMTVIYYKSKPVWTCAYGGKVVEKYYGNVSEIFSFLKRSLKRKDLKRAKDVPIRGPSVYEEKPWKYTFDFEGDMKCFYGREKIFLDDKLAFFQDVIGGLVIGK